MNNKLLTKTEVIQIIRDNMAKKLYDLENKTPGELCDLYELSFDWTVDNRLFYHKDKNKFEAFEETNYN